MRMKRKKGGTPPLISSLHNVVTSVVQAMGVVVQRLRKTLKNIQKLGLV